MQVLLSVSRAPLQHGGQVLLTRAVVDELLGGTGMADAHNPVLERLGGAG
jgi:hypothetical protein